MHGAQFLAVFAQLFFVIFPVLHICAIMRYDKGTTNEPTPKGRKYK